MSMPPYPGSARDTPLVQLCHGAPGLLLLLAAARNNQEFKKKYWRSTWDAAVAAASDRVWEQGLLSKGGGVCHGIVGNAWPWLLFAEEDIEHSSASTPADPTASSNSTVASASMDPPSRTPHPHLSRALAFLLEARATPPFSTALVAMFPYNAPPLAPAVGNPAVRHYRTPDRPFSLFEGFAGTICAWADACTVILGVLDRRAGKTKSRGVIGGIPGVGGFGVGGLL